MPYASKLAEVAHRKNYRKLHLEELREKDRARAKSIREDPVLWAKKQEYAREARRKRREDPAVYEKELAAQRGYYKNRMETDPAYRAEEVERCREYRQTPEAREIAAASHALRMQNEAYKVERARRQELRASVRRRNMALLKMDRPCYDCGGVFPPECMDWDHLPGKEKLFDISKSQTRSLERTVEEIAKCQLVCACCHRTRTFSRGAK